MQQESHPAWQKMFALAYARQDADVFSKGSPFMGEEVEVTTKV